MHGAVTDDMAVTCLRWMSVRVKYECDRTNTYLQSPDDTVIRIFSIKLIGPWKGNEAIHNANRRSHTKTEHRDLVSVAQLHRSSAFWGDEANQNWRTLNLDCRLRVDMVVIVWNGTNVHQYF